MATRIPKSLLPFPMPRGLQTRRIAHMMKHTGMSDEGCRMHLIAGTAPQATTPARIRRARAWKIAMKTLP